MLICNQLRLNFEFWRSSFARMLVGVASKIKRLSSAQVWRSSVSELLVVTASAPLEKIDVFLVEYVIFQSCSSSGEARRDIEIPRD